MDPQLKIRSVLGCLGVVLVTMLTQPCSAEPDPREILKFADRARGNLDGVEWRLEIVSNEDGRTHKRRMVVKARGYDFLATLKSPSRVKGQQLLMHNRNMWFLKPGLSKPVPISSRQKLLGAAVFGDIAATNYAQDYDIVAFAQVSLGETACYFFDLKSVAKKVTYDTIRYWISKDRLVGIKSEFYSVSGRLLKSAVFEYGHRVRIDDDWHPFISKMTISDNLTVGNETSMTFTHSRVKHISPATFDLNLLMMQ